MRISSWRSRFGLAAMPALVGLGLLFNLRFVATKAGIDLLDSVILIVAVGCSVLIVRALRVRLDVAADHVVIVNVWSTRTVSTESIALVQTELLPTWKPWPTVGVWLVLKGNPDARRPKRRHVSVCRGRRLASAAVAAFEGLGVPSDTASTPQITRSR